MPSRSKAQQRFMGLVHAYKKGEVPASKVSKAVKDAAKSMKKKSTKDFASTKHDDLPNKVKEYLMSENPAASAAAAMVMMKLQNPSTGKKISAVTPLRDKDHPLHKKSKGIFQRLKDKFMKKNKSVNEDGHTDVASIERKLKLIIQDSVDTIKKLRSMSNEDSLPSWWTDKITLAKDYVGKSRDYIMNPAESVNEAVKNLSVHFPKRTMKQMKDVEKFVKKRIPKAKFKQKGNILHIDGGGKPLKRLSNDIYNNFYVDKVMWESVNEATPMGRASVVGLSKNKDLVIPKNQMSKAKGQYKKMMNHLMKAGKSMNQSGEIDMMVSHMEDAYDEMLALWKNVKEVKKESVNEATSLGADMLLGGIATVIKKAGMRPKTAKMMGGGFKVSKRDKVGFKIEVEIRGMDKKETFPLQFETERGMLYVVIKNKPIKLGKYTMVNQAAQNLKKVGAALIGDKDVKRIA